MSSARAHLSGRCCGKIDMRPLLFDGFTVCPPDAFCEVEGVIRLTGSAVGGEMEFWDQIGEPELAGVKVRVVLGQAFEVVD